MFSATKHLNDLKLMKKFQKINVLIEKPLFDKYEEINISSLKNRYFVGYNLRFHPVIDHIKNLHQKFFCECFAPRSYQMEKKIIKNLYPLAKVWRWCFIRIKS